MNGQRFREWENKAGEGGSVGQRPRERGTEAPRERQIPEEKVQRPRERGWGWQYRDTVVGEATEV